MGKHKIMKKIAVIIVLISCIGLVQAQEMRVYLGTGLSGQKVSVNQGKNKLKLGGHLGVSYTQLLTKSVGISLGVELGLHNNSVDLENTTFKNYDIDSKNSAFEYRIQTVEYSEKNRLTTVAIPLMLQVKTGSKTQFYISGGAKLLMPISSKVTATADKLELSGYYPNINLVIDDLPNRGFGTLNNWSSENTTTFKMGIALSLSTGLGFKVAEKSTLYIGCYVDYGISDMLNKDEKSLLNYGLNGMKDIKTNGVVTTKNATSAKIRAFGVKVMYGFGI